MINVVVMAKASGKLQKDERTRFYLCWKNFIFRSIRFSLHCLTENEKITPGPSDGHFDTLTMYD